MILSLLWTVMAQVHMRDSWRIGIDTETKTELITTGLFNYSRNPIFLGMLFSLTGLLLATPNLVTIVVWVVGFMSMQMQIRLEEEFLVKQYGQVHTKYRLRVGRWC
jgi:protein-S-isoprenylcysteine O-methyltransferase Ste14